MNIAYNERARGGGAHGGDQRRSLLGVGRGRAGALLPHQARLAAATRGTRRREGEQVLVRREAVSVQRQLGGAGAGHAERGVQRGGGRGRVGGWGRRRSDTGTGGCCGRDGARGRRDRAGRPQSDRGDRRVGRGRSDGGQPREEVGEGAARGEEVEERELGKRALGGAGREGRQQSEQRLVRRRLALERLARRRLSRRRPENQLRSMLWARNYARRDCM